MGLQSCLSGDENCDNNGPMGWRCFDRSFHLVSRIECQRKHPHGILWCFFVPPSGHNTLGVVLTLFFFAIWPIESVDFLGMSLFYWGYYGFFINCTVVIIIPKTFMLVMDSVFNADTSKYAVHHVLASKAVCQGHTKGVQWSSRGHTEGIRATFHSDFWPNTTSIPPIVTWKAAVSETVGGP